MSLQTIVTTSRLVAAFVYCSLSTNELYAFVSVKNCQNLIISVKHQRYD